MIFSFKYSYNAGYVHCLACQEKVCFGKDLLNAENYVITNYMNNLQPDLWV